MTEIARLAAETESAVANAQTLDALEEARLAVLGKKGWLSAALKELGALAPDERKARAQSLNEVKDRVTTALETRKTVLADAAIDARLKAETLDMTLPLNESAEQQGRIHPVSQVIDEITEIFAAMGFSIAEGPDIEDDFHNFTALNIPPEHPARQMQDTFYLPKRGSDGEQIVLRTHTSPVQVRTMRGGPPPYRIIVPGRTYRSDYDMTHTPMFHQVEGLVIDRATHMGHLKGVLTEFCKAFFETDKVKMRFRPSYFPFTEPSAEVDINCSRDGGVLRVGEGSDWLEILGSGMVNPKVLEYCGLDPNEWQGFAFGMGIDRIAMLKYGIPDLRSFFDADLRWLKHYGFVPLDIPTLGQSRAMKFTLAWLKSHLDTAASLDEIAAKLTAIGLEVEGIEDRAAIFAPFIVAEVKKAEQHPNADKLRVCEVFTGTETFQVVCGAPNARAGMKGIFAPVGSTVPGTQLLLKAANIRGVASNGMLCSEREMGLTDEHTGIIDLPLETPLGAPMASVFGLDDPVIEIKLTPNRGDCLGIHGIARDLAAAGLGKLRPLEIKVVPGAYKSPIDVALDFPAGVEKACPIFVGRHIRGVKNGPSPAWLQQRLKAIGLRPISALVDITNFFTYDLGRPLHVFDAAKVKGNITARLAKAGEKLLALDGKEYVLDDSITVIADDAGPEGLGGVMGGEHSGCSFETTEVFVESAWFDPLRTAATGRKLGIHSDARHRFERTVDPAFVKSGIDVATQMILDLCGGEPSETVIAGREPDWKKTVSLRPSRLLGLVGFDLPVAEQTRILDSLGFTVSKNGDVLSVDVPSWRPDIDGEADLVEEIARLHGFDAIPAEPLPPLRAVPAPAVTAGQRRVRVARRALAARGLTEAVTYSFIRHAEAEVFGGGQEELRLVNPISADMDTMRPSILPGLIAAAKRNMDRGTMDVALFEIGPQYASVAMDGQSIVAAGLRRGATGARHWRDRPRNVDGYDAKADALAALSAAGVDTAPLMVMDGAPGWYHPGRSGTLRLGPKTILATFGELHPRVLQKLDIKGPVVAFEVWLERIPASRGKAGVRTKPALKLSELQAVERDFAFIVDADVQAENLLKAVRGSDKALIARASVFDIFAGAGIPEGKKSLAISVRLEPSQQTLTDAEIEAVAKKIVAAAEKACGATLRA